MKFTIRRVSGDKFYDEIKQAQRATLPYDKALDSRDGIWWLAWAEDGSVAGFASMHASRRWAQTGFLSRAGVLLHYQGFGLQKRLIRARERYAKRLGWEWLITDTTENPASANSLIACGFKMYEPSYPYRVNNTCYWRKKV
jgi:GNAT superfamily N-acetyltransferase